MKRFKHFFSNLFHGLSPGQRLFAFVLTLAVFAVLLTLLSDNLQNTWLISAVMLAVLWVSRPIWLPAEYGKTLVRQLSLATVSAVALSLTLWEPLVDAVLREIAWPWLQTHLPALQNLPLPARSSPLLVFGFVLLGVFIVNYLMRDTSAMRAHSVPAEKEFPEKDFKQKRADFCNLLRDDLNKLDRETNWSAAYFTPLDAEVEIQARRGKLKKVTDLLSAIKADRHSRAFLVLGDPGSGKSVALRKLCRELLDEVERTDKVPLYVNLREWMTEGGWSEDNPPTVQQLYNFVLDNLKERSDVFGNRFLDTYFDKMLDHGYFFLVLDSFDEIPAVLDENESSWLIHTLSGVIHQFLAGAHDSRGILASRMFRRPTDNFAAEARLEIRPFTEAKIIQTLKNVLGYSEDLVKQLFTERLELVPVARNPFSAALIADYAKNHNNALPPNQATLYASYISQRLDDCADRIYKRNLYLSRKQDQDTSPPPELSKASILACATDIADLMFTKLQKGLEATVEELAAHLPQHPVEEVINILVYGRLGRLGSGDEGRFSFAHRRFNEYFVAQRFIEQPERVPRDAIPTDSRWRDALVLYCEVAEEREAEQIAKYCWSEVEKISTGEVRMDTPQYLRGVHSLRFLVQVFQGRPTCLSSFRHNLAKFIDTQVTNMTNLLVTKFAVESVGLLEKKEINNIVVKAFEIGSDWINETALSACRHLPKLTHELKLSILKYIISMKISETLYRYKDLKFSLSLSSGFKAIQIFHKIILFDAYLFAIICIFISILYWPVMITGIFLLLFLSRSLPLFDMQPSERFFRLLIFFSYVISIKLEGENKIMTLYYILLELGLFMPPNFVFLTAIPIIPLIIVIYYIYVIYISSILLTNALYEKLTSVNRHNVINIAINGIHHSILSTRPLYYLIILAGGLMSFFLMRLNYDQSDYMFSKVEDTVGVIGGLLILIAALTAPFGIILHIYDIILDFYYLQKCKSVEFTTRENIKKYFYKFKIGHMRLKFVRQLQKSGIKPTGQWPDGKLPNVNNDAASTLLAQLEEKWLGLDR